MAQQNESNFIILRSQLQCTKNLLQCQGIDPNGINLQGYCYLPVSEIAVTYKPNTTNFTCPFGYVDATVPAIVSQTNPPPSFRGCKWMCTNSISGNCITWDYKCENNVCQWTNPQNAYSKTGIKTYGDYSIYTGISAYSVWQPSPMGWDCNYSGQPSTMPGAILAITCTTTAPVMDYNGPIP